jgi:UDP-N-acetylmuramate-alanine ligase
LQSVEDLWQIFAKRCGGKYLKSFEEVESIIKKADNNDIIIVYSAGDIDYTLRRYLHLI